MFLEFRPSRCSAPVYRSRRSWARRSRATTITDHDQSGTSASSSVLSQRNRRVSFYTMRHLVAAEIRHQRTDAPPGSGSDRVSGASSFRSPRRGFFWPLPASDHPGIRGQSDRILDIGRGVSLHCPACSARSTTRGPFSKLAPGCGAARCAARIPWRIPCFVHEIRQ